MSQENTSQKQTEVTVRLFASLRETLGCSQCQFSLSELDGEPTVQKLRQSLIDSRGSKWAALNSDDVRIAVNHTVVDESTRLQCGDELAFFPPVTGG